MVQIIKPINSILEYGGALARVDTVTNRIDIVKSGWYSPQLDKRIVQQIFNKVGQRLGELHGYLKIIARICLKTFNIDPAIAKSLSTQGFKVEKIEPNGASMYKVFKERVELEGSYIFYEVYSPDLILVDNNIVTTTQLCCVPCDADYISSLEIKISTIKCSANTNYNSKKTGKIVIREEIDNGVHIVSLLRMRNIPRSELDSLVSHILSTSHTSQGVRKMRRVTRIVYPVIARTSNLSDKEFLCNNRRLVIRDEVLYLEPPKSIYEITYYVPELGWTKTITYAY